MVQCYPRKGVQVNTCFGGHILERAILLRNVRNMPMFSEVRQDLTRVCSFSLGMLLCLATSARAERYSVKGTTAQGGF